MTYDNEAEPAERTPVRAIGRVRLRVRDLEQSRRFYEHLIGLSKDLAEQSEVRLLLKNDPQDKPWHFDLELLQGVSRGAQPSIEHFSFRVSGEKALKSLHARAVGMGIETTEPRLIDGEWRFFVYDPDGHKIGVYAVAGPSRPDGRGA